MIKEKCVVSKLNIIISQCSKNHVGEFCSKIRKEKKSVAIVVTFYNTVLHDIFLYYNDYSNYLPRVRPALFHVDNKMILNETKTKAMVATVNGSRKE